MPDTLGGWFIGGGIAHSAADARRALFASTGGGEGVGGTSALKVLPLVPPGAGFRVLPGPGLIRSRYAPGETYQAAPILEQSFTNPPASTPRSDMVVMAVEDPWATNSPWPAAGVSLLEDVLKIRVIPNVPPTARKLEEVPGHQDDTALPLARITYAAPGSDITDPMLEDLRFLPGEAPTSGPTGGGGVASAAATRNYAMSTGAPEQPVTATAAAGQVWPAAAPATWEDVTIPAAATHANALMVHSSTLARTGTPVSPKSSWGEVWLELSADAQSVASSRTGWDTPASGGTVRLPIILAKELTIPPELRGKKVKVRPMARLLGNDAAGGAPAILDQRCEVAVRLEFFTKAT